MFFLASFYLLIYLQFLQVPRKGGERLQVPLQVDSFLWPRMWVYTREAEPNKCGLEQMTLSFCAPLPHV